MGHFEAPWVGIRLWYVLASGSHGVEALLLRSVVVSAGRGAGVGGGGLHGRFASSGLPICVLLSMVSCGHNTD